MIKDISEYLKKTEKLERIDKRLGKKFTVKVSIILLCIHVPVSFLHTIWSVLDYVFFPTIVCIMINALVGLSISNLRMEVQFYKIHYDAWVRMDHRKLKQDHTGICIEDVNFENM